MKNKYLFILIPLVILLAFALPACGGGDKNTTTVQTTPPASSQTTTPPATNINTSDISLTDVLGKGAKITSVKFDTSITAGTRIVAATTWQKDKKLKEEITYSGTTTIMLFDLAENVMYTYLPAQNTAIKAVLNAHMMFDTGSQDMGKILGYNPTVVGTETIDGKDCVTITYNISVTDSAKAWIWIDTGFPLKVEMNTPAGATTIDYRNIDFSEIADSLFELPEGVIIVSTG